MAAQKGKDLLLKLGDGAGGFVTVAGMRSRQLAFNAETVDVTNADSAGRWRELLAGAGVRRAALSGSTTTRRCRIGATNRTTSTRGLGGASTTTPI